MILASIMSSICWKHGVIILNYTCQIFEANKGLEKMLIFTFSTLRCFTSVSLCEPKVSYSRNNFGCFLVLIIRYFPIVKRLRLIIKILSKIWGFWPFLVYFGTKTSNSWQWLLYYHSKGHLMINMLLWGTELIKLMPLPQKFEANLYILKIRVKCHLTQKMKVT